MRNLILGVAMAALASTATVRADDNHAKHFLDCAKVCAACQIEFAKDTGEIVDMRAM